MTGHTAKNRRRLVWAGTAVVLGGGLNALQLGLGAVHLRGAVLALITVLIITVTTLVSLLQERRTRSEALKELEESLDVMLACWPPRSASRLTPYDVGVHPDLAGAGNSPPYVGRDRDPEIDSAIRATGIAVVFGAAGAGKSRSAFEAVMRAAPGAAMVIPASAEGLPKLMQQARELPLFEQPTVLWLDGLERFSKTLDMDPIDALVHPERRERWIDRFLSKLPWRRRAELPKMIVVATVRSDDLERLLGDGADGGHEIRRLLAHARGVPLSERLSGNERDRFRETYGHEPAGHTVGEAFPRSWSDGWKKAVPRKAARMTGGIGTPGWATVLAGILVFLVAWLVHDVHNGGWTEPAPIATQVTQLSNKIRPCQRLEAYPKRGKGLTEGAVLVAIVHGGDCPMSDEVRFYRQKNKRLKQISALTPTGEGVRQTFSCIGRNKVDPCHVRLAGGSRVIAGAFMDTDTSQEVALVVSFGGDEGLRLSALSPPAAPPRTIPTAVQAVDKPNVTLRLRVGGTSPAGAGCDPNQGCLLGRPAAAIGVLPASSRHPAILLAGYVASGTTEAPEVLSVRAWRINMPPAGAPRAQRGRDCLVLTDGTPVALEPRMKPQADPRKALFRSADPGGRSRLMC